MAADLDFASTVDVLFDYCEVVALVGALDWKSFVQGYLEYEASSVGETDALPKSKADRRPLVPVHARVA